MGVKRGTRVSLNKAIRNYYFQGPSGINLRAGIEDTVIIPNTISDRNLEIINNSIEKGHLTLGWAIEPAPEVKYKEDDKGLLNKGVRKMMPFLEEIAKTPGRGDDAPVARLEKMLALEKNDKKRKTVIEKIEELLSNMSGISSVEEEEKERIQINVV